jgi:uncharacterized membrane protein YgaE (UPF0421/DUF939 family)
MLILLIGIVYINISSMVKTQDIIYKKNLMDVINLIELRSDQNAIRAQMLEKLLTKSKDSLKKIDEDIEQRSKEIDKSVKTVIELEKDNTESLKKLKELQS